MLSVTNAVDSKNYARKRPSPSNGHRVWPLQIIANSPKLLYKTRKRWPTVSAPAIWRNNPQAKILMIKANPAMLASVERTKPKTVQIVSISQENRNWWSGQSRAQNRPSIVIGWLVNSPCLPSSSFFDGDSHGHDPFPEKRTEKQLSPQENKGLEVKAYFGHICGNTDRDIIQHFDVMPLRPTRFFPHVSPHTFLYTRVSPRRDNGSCCPTEVWVYCVTTP